MISRSYTKLPSLFAITVAAASALTGTVFAQDADTDQANALFEEILVTATKKSALQSAQDVPVAVTAYGERQLDALQFTTLESLSFKMPNVALDDIGTMRGVANFTIRGIGVNSSIPSIEPTVGVFVDGMYYGVNAGVVFDQFDLESVEVLRGPQGLLFGRNVTGGAVLLNTTKPSFEPKARARASYESGNNFTVSGTYAGPLIEDKLAIKIAAYYNHDSGYFDVPSLADTSHGDAETILVRPAFTFKMSDSAELTVRYEHGESKGDGPASQNRGVFDRNTFDMDFDNEGYYDNTWDQVIAQVDVDVDFGEGTITNITAWRDFESFSSGDIDARTLALFHSEAEVRTEQFSNELRYNGTFGDLEVTTGLFYFEQDLQYLERRIIAFGTLDIAGGGDTSQSTKAAFANVDYHMSDTMTLTFGLRYTDEDKEGLIASIDPFPTHGCDLVTDTCVYDFPSLGTTTPDKISSSTWTPKIGFSWTPKEDMQVYGHYTQGHRSGGYNLRNTSPTATPAPFSPEKQHSFELGIKADNADKTVRVNGAVFYNLLDNLQREINLPDPTAGVVQLIKNTADARVMGAEVEVIAQIHENLTFVGSLGVLDNKYRNILFDLTNDGVVNDNDLALDLPRLSPFTYGFGLIYNAPIEDWGSLTANINFNHRDESWYNDANTALLDAVDMLDASVTLGLMDDSVRITLYGKNLLDEVQAGGETLLPASLLGGTFSPLKKGRIYGVSMKYAF